MASTISNFKSQLKGGGARPNLFEVDVTCATGWLDEAEREFKFLCKATSMPTQTIGSVDVPFRGRILKVAGDRTFEPWSVTVINDESFDIRQSFEQWQELINGITSGNGKVEPSSYMSQGTIRQLGRTQIGSRDPGSAGGAGQGGDVLYTYTVRDIWPSEIGSIDLSYESSDAIEEFTVTFQVNYMERGGKTEPATGAVKSKLLTTSGGGIQQTAIA